MKPFFCLLLLCLTGCVSSQMQTWIGQSSDTLLSAWGPPQSRHPRADGGSIWTYYQHRPGTAPETTSTYIRAGSIASAQTTTSGGLPARNVRRTFTLDSHGTIISYSWQGL